LFADPINAVLRGMLSGWACAVAVASPAWSAVRCTDLQGRAVIATQAAVPQLAGYRCAQPPGPRAALGLDAATAARPGSLGGLRLQVMAAGSTVSADDPSTVQRLQPLIAQAAQRYAHDVHLLKAIIHVESRFNADAVSPKGAVGLMQLMPATARRMGVQGGQHSLLDPHTNVQAGARYLRLLMDMFAGRPELAIAAYNAGEGAVLRHQRQIPPFRETQDYVERVLAQYEHYKAQ
jgi:soluble lytic murein transglycosylase-like protein